MLESVLLALVMQYLESYWTEFHLTFSIDAFWEKRNASVFGVKGQGHSVTKVSAGRGIQRSMLCIASPLTVALWNSYAKSMQRFLANGKLIALHVAENI